MAGKIREIIDSIIQERSEVNPAIAEMTKAKFILKGISPDKYDRDSADDPLIIKKLLSLKTQLNDSSPAQARKNIKSVFSLNASEAEAVLELRTQLDDFNVKLLIFFASSSYDLDQLCGLMQETFENCIVFGCSTAGEIANGEMLNHSVVAMAFSANVIADAQVEVIEELNRNPGVDQAFSSFGQHFAVSPINMDPARYLGLVLIDGLSMRHEVLMDQIGNNTNVYFVGGSAGDDSKYIKTFVCANGRAYTDSAVLALLKMDENAEFGIIKSQSFKKLAPVLKASKVKPETREVIEFNNRPAILAYADALGLESADDAPNYFMSNPLGLSIGENDIFVRSPLRKRGTNMELFCNLLEGMEVNLLESTDIIEDTKLALENKRQEFGTIEGIINFNCILRTQEMEKKNQLRQYGALFKDFETVGFSTYGEEFIGHINQTATMLVFKTDKTKSIESLETSLKSEVEQSPQSTETGNEALLRRIDELNRILQERNKQLEETTEALKQFNIHLEEEILERTRREDDIRYLSYHDILTGLFNRRFYEEEIKRLDTARNLPISIIMGDVNGLKFLNDHLGHEKGDELIQKAAAAIRRACRTDEIIARWGGDEFVILLPQTQREEAEKVIGRINSQMQNEYVSSLPVSVSFGVETKMTTNDDIMKILKKAEDNMYAHKKRTSQNRQRHANENFPD